MAVDALFSVGGKVAELLVEPITRRLMYIVRPKRNIPKLKSQVEKLEALRKAVQGSIDSAIRNGQVIREDVKLWTATVDKLIKEAQLFLQGGTNENSKCFRRLIPNLATRYHQGKWADEKTKEFDELLKDGNFTNISNPAPPLGIEAVPSGSADMTYKATNSAMEKVMEALRDDSINFIGIHGIGGVGKTTLVKDIGKRVKEDRLFDEVVMAVVSQNQDIRKIQGEMAGFLGSNLTDETSERARKLYTRIKQVPRILVILDDVWDNLNLVAAGIPFDDDHKGCKIIITTRREQVCRAMGTVGRRKTILLDVLSEEDSWHLFRLKAGSGVDSPKLNVVAKEVWRECGHLPLALVTVGSAMSGKEDPNDWMEAAQQLKDAAPHDIEGVEKHVYKSIKLSFDYLEDELAQNMFLLCSLFPEDHDIEIEDLVRYGWGLRNFRGAIDTLRGVRRRANTVINNLKEASLLLPSNEEMCIKMHDIVRDVAISIGSGKYIFVSASAGGHSLENWPVSEETMDQYKGISLMGDHEVGNYPVAWDFPKLNFLLLIGFQIGSSLCTHYLSKLKELNVLHLSPQSPHIHRRYVDRMELGPGHYAFSHLRTCLRTLILRWIDAPDIGAIGKISALEILDLRGCCFYEAPNASWIKALTNLRVLDLRYTLAMYGQDEADSKILFLSPNLTHLEELYAGWNIILSWDEINIARILPRLKVLQAISPRNIQTMPSDFFFPHQLELFHIIFGSGEGLYPIWDNHTPTLIMFGSMEPAYVWRGRLTTLLTKCGALEMDTWDEVVSILPDLTDDLKLLTRLKVQSCDEFRYIIDHTTDDGWNGVQPPSPQQLLSSLEHLCLDQLPRLEYLFKLSTAPSSLHPHPHQHQPVFVDLRNLKHVTINCCHRLKYLFQPAIAQSLAQLEKLSVYECVQLEEIVADDQNDDQVEEGETDEKNIVLLVFPNLKEVYFYDLPNFRGFCTRGDLFFDCPSLEYLGVCYCPKMTKFFATTSTSETQSTPKLKSVDIGGDLAIIPQGMDLNQFLQYLHHLGRAEEAQQESNTS